MSTADRVPTRRRFPAALFALLAAAYVVWPVDLIPDVPPLGWADDALVALAAALPYLRGARRFLHAGRGRRGSRAAAMVRSPR